MIKWNVSANNNRMLEFIESKVLKNPYRMLGLTIDANENDILLRYRQYQNNTDKSCFVKEINISTVDDSYALDRDVDTLINDIQSKLQYAQFWFSDPLKIIRNNKNAIDVGSLITSYPDGSTYCVQNRFVKACLLKDYTDIIKYADQLYISSRINELFGNILYNSKLLDPNFFIDNLQMLLIEDTNFTANGIEEDDLSDKWKDFINKISVIRNIRNMISNDSFHYTDSLNIKSFIELIKNSEIATLKNLEGFRCEVANKLLELILVAKRNNLNTSYTNDEIQIITDLLPSSSYKSMIKKKLQS